MHSNDEAVVGAVGGLSVVENKEILWKRRRLDVVGRVEGTIGIGAIDRGVARAGQNEPASHFRVYYVYGNNAAVVRRQQAGGAGLVTAIGDIFEVLAPDTGDFRQRLTSFIINHPQMNGAGVASDQATTPCDKA